MSGSYNKEALDELFENLNSPYHPGQPDTEAPVYIPTPKNAGPQPLSIEDYIKRQNNHRQQPEQQKQQKPKRKRTGQKVKTKQEIGNLYRLAGLARGDQKRRFIEQAKNLQRQANVK